MMRASLENTQRGDAVSKRAGRRNDQSENRDALRASSWRLLLRERGAAQNAFER
jgi:hypothetical protein